MTPEEARKILDECRDDYHDFSIGQPYCIDGFYTVEQLEALLVLARQAAAKETG